MTTNRRPKADIMLEIRLHDVATAADSQDVYNQLYSEAGISQSRSFYQWMYDKLALQPGDVYLDISCGRGELTHLAQAAGIEAHGLDLSFAALRQGRTVDGTRHLLVGNAERLPYASGRFSVVSNIGSLEHFLDMKTAVRETARILQANGRAIILVPNTFSLLTNIWIAFRQGRTSIDDQPIQRYAARYEWQQLLEENGLRVEKTMKYERIWPRSKADWNTYLRHPKEMVRLLLTPFIPLNLAWSFIFICRKTEAHETRSL